MIYPNKFISFDSSILSKLHLISEIDIDRMPLPDLYYILQKKLYFI